MPSYAIRERPKHQPPRLLEVSELDRVPLKRLIGHALARVDTSTRLRVRSPASRKGLGSPTNSARLQG